MLDPAGFVSLVERVWGQARQHMARDHVVREVLLLVDPVAGRLTQVIPVHPDEYTPDAVRDAEAAGAVLVPGALRDQQETLAGLVDRSGAQAAIHVGEEWVVSGAAAGEVIAGSAPRPSEHPDRVERVAVSGLWPLAAVTVQRAARIVRDDAGAPSLVADDTVAKPVTVGVGGPDDAADAFVYSSGWLEDLLPHRGPA